MNVHPKSFAGVASNYQRQNFAVEIDGEKLYLVVQNEDQQSWKRLGAWAEILPANPVTSPWSIQTAFQGEVEEGRTITVWNRQTGKSYKPEDERKRLIMALAGALLDKLFDYFPMNKFVQYAEPAQTELGADHLKQIRAKLNLTQTDFAAFLGNSAKRTVQDWESGARKIPSTVVEILRLKGQI